MPELAEIEAARSLAHEVLAGRTIVAVKTASDDIVYDESTPRQIARRVKGKKVVGTGRWGKHFWIELENGPALLLHFGMTGAFHVHRVGAEPPRFWKLVLSTDDGKSLAMTNARRLGRIRLVDDPRERLGHLGFDPLLNLPGPAEFRRLLTRRKSPVKAVLLDQSFAAGVGNWIADEVLYHAGIAPHRRANELDDDEVETLRRKIRSIIRRAVSVDADSGRFPRTWLFHRRWGKTEGAETARKEKIEFTTIAGRTAAWVPDVQR